MLSEWGYWGEELIGPLETFDEAGYEVDFMTPTGKRPVAITVSMDPVYVDPPSADRSPRPRSPRRSRPSTARHGWIAP